MSQQVTILGSTGSIGASSLDVISRHPEDFKIFALTANVAYQTLADQCVKYNPSYAVVMKQNIAQNMGHDEGTLIRPE
jgi:1-deoxy-D-xylulose-5-phosphate reductoisomerase